MVRGQVQRTFMTRKPPTHATCGALPESLLVLSLISITTVQECTEVGHYTMPYMPWLYIDGCSGPPVEAQ